VRLFGCSVCGQVLFFENSLCTSCGTRVGYCVEARELVALPSSAESTTPFMLPVANVEQPRFVLCRNFTENDACNWLVLAADAQPYCHSCRLTDLVPDLSDAQNRSAWADIEAAKRRLLYTLHALNLPIWSKDQNGGAGLAFKFLRSTDDQPVMTGHSEGTITLNIAEADASFRENMREKLGEGYRTVLGHLRHEIGHYYWDRLVRDTQALEPFRARFGDERQSYDAAIARHYEQGPPGDWSESFISAYATMHPWEDWAETWAHYLHMLDTLETAKSHGLTVRIPGEKPEVAQVSTDKLALSDFESLSAGWQAVTVALNSLSRSMGMKDVYPFVVSPPVQDKLRFVHELIHNAPATLASGQSQPTAADAAPEPSVSNTSAAKPPTSAPSKPAEPPATEHPAPNVSSA
jgi:hypothetical protein